MQELIKFFKSRLQEELPHSDIRKEGLDPKLEAIFLEEEKNVIERFKMKPPKICAVMVAVYPHENQLYLPMMERPAYSRAHPGQIAFPGGKKEEGDKDLIHTAIREMEEEVGVRVPQTNIFGALSTVYIPPSNSLVTPILGYLPAKPTYIPDEEEVERALDIPLNALANPVNKKAKKVVLTNGDYFEMPAFAVQDVFIWGGTARMIMEINKLMKEFYTTVQGTRYAAGRL